MVHRAYDSFNLLTDCPAKIEAIGSYASNILLGCADGSLRIYVPRPSVWSPPPDSRSELRMKPYVLQRNVAGFTKRPFLSMEVLTSSELLLTLSESIAFHRLPNLETVTVLTKARGANVCSWDEKRGFLCFARQNRIFIFRHDGEMGFAEVKEFGVPDPVKSMSWCGENICLGIGREYMIMNATNGALSEVFPCGRLAPPLVVPIPTGELILGKDNSGVFVDQTGKLLPEDRICWSEAPQEVVIHKTHAIGLLPRYVEIRSLQVPYPLIQTVVLGNVRHLVQSGSAIVVAQDNSVHGFFPVPIGAQLVQLTRSGNFEEAFALCKMLPPEVSNLRAAKERLIRVRYAHYLFENGHCEEAMDQFLASEVDINHVLSLFPSITLPRMDLVPEPEELMYTSWDNSYLSGGSSGVSDNMELSPPPYSPEFLEHSALESKKMSHNTLMALVKFLQKKRRSIIEKGPTEGTEEAVLDAVGDGIPSYDISRFERTNKKKRRSIIEKGPTEGTEEVVLDAVGDRIPSYDFNRFDRTNKKRATIAISSVERDMATKLDTALLQALLLTGQSSAAVELLKGLNYCDVRICEVVLQKRSHCAALLQLYRSDSMHREALKLLHQLVEESKSNESKAGPTLTFTQEMMIEYLKRRATRAISSVDRDMASILDRALLRALFLTGQSSAAVELLKGLDYSDEEIREEILGGRWMASFLEGHKGDNHEALEFLHHLVEESKSNDQVQARDDNSISQGCTQDAGGGEGATPDPCRLVNLACRRREL